MSSTSLSSASRPVVIHIGPLLARLSETEFFEICQLNRDWRIERTSQGDLVIMPPTGGNTGWRNLDVTTQLGNWCRRDGTGIAFDSSTGFQLPNGAQRSPDATWIRRERWAALDDEQKEKFPPLAPDFVVELRSKNDHLDDLRSKMHEYLANGVRLGWLIDPYTRRVEVFRSGQEVMALDHPTSIDGSPELPGFVLDLDSVW